jgi:hypothetical protein
MPAALGTGKASTSVLSQLQTPTSPTRPVDCTVRPRPECSSPASKPLHIKAPESPRRCAAADAIMPRSSRPVTGKNCHHQGRARSSLLFITPVWRPRASPPTSTRRETFGSSQIREHASMRRSPQKIGAKSSPSDSRRCRDVVLSASVDIDAQKVLIWGQQDDLGLCLVIVTLSPCVWEGCGTCSPKQITLPPLPNPADSAHPFHDFREGARTPSAIGRADHAAR